MPGKPRDTADVARAYLENARNVKTTARALGAGRSTVKNHLLLAREQGILPDYDPAEANTPLRDEYLGARARKVAAFQKKQRKGSWDKPVLVNLPHRPFRLKLFGDPHMDADAFDVELFERHWLEMDAENGVYGICIGDWFNNWLRVLAHLWKHEGDPDDAWLMFEHYMGERGDALLGACSGNHDDWTHGPADPVDLMMKRHGVVYRKGAVRLFLNAGGPAPLRVALRHKWRGHSMYSPAHGIRRAAEKGWEDHLMVGGHIHQDEPRMYVQPRSGFISHICQISAFKRFDEYADVHGFMGHTISPVWDLVIDPAREDTDPDKIKTFWDSTAAARYLAAIR